MNFLTNKHLDRRTLLKGVGAAIALPALDAMFPALAAPVKQARRLAVVYVPNGIIMKDWKPAAAGQDFAFTRILKPLEPFRQDITLLSGLANHAAEKAKGGGHAKASGSFLSGAEVKYTAGPDVHAGVTFDQVVAQHSVAEMRVPSLQIGCEDARMVGNCDTGSSCAYTNSLSWTNPDTPLPVTVNPRSVFERLFGAADPERSGRCPCAPRPVPQEHSGPHPRRCAAPDDRFGRSRPAPYGSIPHRHSRNRNANRRLGERSHHAAIREAFRNSIRVPGLREGDVRPAGHRLPGRPHARLHHDAGPRRQRSRVPRNRRSRPAPSAHAPSRSSRFYREGHEDQLVPCRVVRRICSAIEGYPGRRRHAAGSFRDSLRQRAERRKRAFEFRLAAARRGPRRWFARWMPHRFRSRERPSPTCSCS